MQCQASHGSNNQMVDMSMRVIQLTDIHLKSDQQATILNCSPDAGLRQVLRSIESREKSADALLLTGDLTDDASSSAYSRLRQMLQTLRKPVFVLPGNHDLPERMRESLVGSFIQMQEVCEIGGWALLFLDSRIAGQDHGCVNEADLSKVENFLSSNPDKHCLLALHHSAFSECYSPGCHLENARDLLALAARHENLKLVISGHTHWSVERLHGGTQFLSTPSTFLHVSHTTHPGPGDIESNHGYRSLGAYRVVDLFADGSFATEVCEVEIERG
jgi:3',5'-cyclic-AMP phosphodiesterase